MKRIWFLYLSLCVCAHAQYAVIDLGRYIVPTGINNRGEIIIALKDGPAIYANGRIKHIGMLPGDNIGYGLAVNDLGEVVGYSRNSLLGQNGPIHAFLYASGKLIDLGNVGTPTGINDCREILTYFPNNADVVFEVLYADGRLVDIGKLPSAWNPSAYAINNVGQIVGIVYTPPSGRAYTFIYRDGHIQDIGFFQPNDMNNAGQVVGSNGVSACLYAGGHLTNLGRFPGTVRSEAQFINDCGEIVGVCYPGDLNTNPPQPFIYKGGQMRALRVPGWIITEIDGFNDASEIICTGILSSGKYSELSTSYHGLLLRPNSPCTFKGAQFSSEVKLAPE